MKIRRIIIIVPLALLGLALLLSSNLLLRLFFLSVLLLAPSYVWTYYGLRGIRIRFGETPERAQVGDRFDEEITVYNDSRAPRLLLKLEESTNLPGHNNITMLNLKSESATSWQSSVYCRRRGQYHLGQASITAGDPFGLFKQDLSFGQPRYMLVYPATVELPFFEVSAPTAIGSASGGWLAGRTGPNASSVREFAYGDALTKIHWPSTARAGKLMVKVFGEEHSPTISDNIYVIADMHRPDQAGQNEDSTEEYAVTIAASLVKKFMTSGLKVGLIASSDPPCVFRPDNSEEHLDRMLEALALVQANGHIPIDRFTDGWTPRMGNDATAIIVSPAATPLLAKAARQLKVRRNMVGLVWLDTASFGGTAVSPNVTRNLSLLGVQMHIVRKGDELAKALDSRNAPALARYS